MKDTVKDNFPFIFKELHNLRFKYYCFLGKHFPEKLIKKWYNLEFHKEINLDNPQNLDEKVNWMKLHADFSLWTHCADKYNVREYVTKKGLGQTLNTIYGVFDTAEEIDFSKLPEKFVIKTTNGGGGNNVLIVPSKSELNIPEAIKNLNKWLHAEVGYLYVEPHYIGIKPKLMIEKFLKQKGDDISLVDVKLNCFNGKAYSVFLCSDREMGGNVHYSVYDLDWKLYPEKVLPEFRTEKIYPRPQSFDEMIQYSEILSKGIPFVRVDWYEIEGKPVFSEMTFTPGGGFQGFYSLDYLKELGDQLDLKPVNRVR